jgi:ribosomal protein S15P/S13E
MACADVANSGCFRLCGVSPPLLHTHTPPHQPPNQVHTVLVNCGVDDKAVAFVTDFGSNMISAGSVLATKLPNYLVSVQCLQHLLSLTLKDFAKERHLHAMLEQAHSMVTYITRHKAVHAIYDAKKKELNGTALVKPVATRFGSNINMLDSIAKNE